MRDRHQLEEAAAGVLAVGEARACQGVAAAEQVDRLDEHEAEEQQVHQRQRGDGGGRAQVQEVQVSVILQRRRSHSWR